MASICAHRPDRTISVPLLPTMNLLKPGFAIERLAIPPPGGAPPVAEMRALLQNSLPFTTNKKTVLIL